MPKGFEERLVFNENNSGSFKIFVHEYSSPLHCTDIWKFCIFWKDESVFL